MLTTTCGIVDHQSVITTEMRRNKITLGALYKDTKNTTDKDHFDHIYHQAKVR